MTFASDSEHVNNCQLDALIADLNGLGLDEPRMTFLRHLVRAAHNQGYWEGVDSMMPLIGGPCDACGNGADGDDTGGNQPDSPSPTGPGLPGCDSGLGGRRVGDDRDNTDGRGYAGGIFPAVEVIETRRGPVYIQGKLR